MKELPNKNSSGYDQLDTVLLKQIFPCIEIPFCNIVNKSLVDGCFPDCMKIAEVIPLFKNKTINFVRTIGPFPYC